MPGGLSFTSAMVMSLDGGGASRPGPLSGDGTELAVMAVPKAGGQLVLQVYSVAARMA